MQSLNPRQERFCHFFVHYNNASVAAVEAGYERPSARKQGSRLLATVRIRARVHEIQVQLARDAGGDTDALIGKLEIIYRRAMEDHHFYAAARAVELQARLVGMSASRLRSTHPPPVAPEPPAIEGTAEPAPAPASPLGLSSRFPGAA